MWAQSLALGWLQHFSRVGKGPNCSIDLLLTSGILGVRCQNILEEAPKCCAVCILRLTDTRTNVRSVVSDVLIPMLASLHRQSWSNARWSLNTAPPKCIVLWDGLLHATHLDKLQAAALTITVFGYTVLLQFESESMFNTVMQAK